MGNELRRDVPSASLLNQLPWLLDANTWEHEHTFDRPFSPDASGVWPVGNGYTFAHAGLALPFNRLQGLVGPTYQTAEVWSPSGDFGDCWIDLRSARPVPTHRQGIWRPRESGVLVTRATTAGDVALVSIDAALPSRSVIMRVVEVWGARRLGEDAVAVVHLPAGRPRGDRRRALQAFAPRNKVLLAAVAGGHADEGGALIVPLADVAQDGAVARFCVVLAFASSDSDAAALLSLPHDPAVHLDETRAHWHRWLSATRTPDLWPQNLPGRSATERSLRDLIELGKLNLKMQQAVRGGVGPMVHYKGVRARDTNGPVRAFLRMGRLEEVRDQLEYYYRAATALREVPSSAPLDIPIARVPERADWAAVPVPKGDTPSWIVMQHRWWLEAGGDVELVRRHWSYLRRCVTGQQVAADGLLPFHGDETYLHGALYAVYPDRCGWPNDLIADDGEHGYAPWSLDSSIAYVAANEAMAWMSRLAGHEEERAGFLREAVRARSAVERRFWLEPRGYYAPAIYPLSGTPHPLPFAPINLRPLWLGYHRANDPRARRNLAAVVDLLGFSNTTPSCEYTVGHHTGYLLWALLAVDSDLAPLALAHLLATASPAGEWAEIHGPDGGPAAGYHPEAPNRLRPWEGGINFEALLRYFEVRRARDEPDTELRGIARRGGTMGFGPARAPAPPPADVAPEPTVLVTADADEITECQSGDEAPREAKLTILEPGLPFDAAYLERLLFGSPAGGRRVNTLILGASAVRGDRRSMKPTLFWRLPAVTRILDRFEDAGGRLVRPSHH